MGEKPFLPDLEALDPAALKAMICLQHAELISHKTQIEHLELLIAKLRRMQFGRSSEKVERQIEQLELRLEELEATQAEVPPAPASKPCAKERCSAPRKRRVLPGHLPREVHIHRRGLTLNRLRPWLARSVTRAELDQTAASDKTAFPHDV